MRHLTRLAFVLVLLGPGSVAAQDTSVDVAEGPTWDKLLGLEFTLTGVVNRTSRKRLELASCPLRIRIYVRSPKAPPPVGQRVQLVGQISKRDDRLEFVTRRWKLLPSFVDEHAQRRGQLADGDFVAVDRLAAWADRMAQFYKDEALKAVARRGFAEGIRMQGQALRKESDVQGLLELAERAGRLVDEETSQVLVHAAVLRASEDFEGAVLVRKHFPGSESPLSAEDIGKQAAVWGAYDRSPIEAEDIFRRNPDLRPMLLRWLWRRKTLGGFRKAGQALTDRQVGPIRALALRAEAELPNALEVARGLWQRWVRLRQAEADTLSDSEHWHLIVLAREKVGPNPALTKSYRRRLDRQRDALSAGDAHGRQQLAVKYLDLAEDRRKSGDPDMAKRLKDIGIDLLTAAHKLIPDSDPIRQLMEAEGFALDPETDQWVARKDFVDSPLARLLRAARQGRVLRGMTREMVETSQAGPPSRIRRSLTAQGWTEQWIYQGSPPTYVTFFEGKVIGVHPADPEDR